MGGVSGVTNRRGSEEREESGRAVETRGDLWAELSVTVESRGMKDVPWVFKFGCFVVDREKIEIDSRWWVRLER